MTGDRDEAKRAEETERQSPDPYAPDAAADPPVEHTEHVEHTESTVTDKPVEPGSDKPADHFEQQDHGRF